MVSTAEVPDSHIPPFVMLKDVNVLHSWFIARGNVEEIAPCIVHSLHETDSSVLSLAASDDYSCYESQNQDISVH